jgi:asparagine synthase (glutamine-hydrolysing)
MNNNVEIKLDKLYDRIDYEKYKLYVFSNNSFQDILDQLFSAQNQLNFKSLESFIRNAKDLISIVIDSEDFLFCAVDCVGSRPLYYKQKNKNLLITNNPRSIKDNDELINISSLSFEEFISSGFVSGNNTLITNIKQIRSGELLFFDKRAGNLQLKRYFKYFPKENLISNKNLFENLDQVCNEIFKKIINRSKNEQIVVPLSGGYDSRFILAKLCELGAKNLITFSYGNAKSHELLKAKRYAKILNVKWININPKRTDLKSFFLDVDSTNYFNFSDGLRTIPTLSDFYSIKLLISKKIINEKSIIINGQSGDFTTGNHIPSEIYKNDLNIDDVVNIIIKKHFSIFSNRPKSVINQEIKKKIKNQLLDIKNGANSKMNLSSLYECWEWQERQSKYVVNGQRVYEYFDLKWELPLWEPQFVNFWNGMPNKFRFQQRLYKEYLNWYDYQKIFSTNFFDIKLRSFPGKLGAVIVVLDKLTVILPKKFRLIKYLSYLGHYSFVYKYFSIYDFLLQIPGINCPPQGRGIMGMLINKWIDLNKQLFRNK